MGTQEVWFLIFYFSWDAVFFFRAGAQAGMAAGYPPPPPPLIPPLCKRENVLTEPSTSFLLKNNVFFAFISLIRSLNKKNLSPSPSHSFLLTTMNQFIDLCPKALYTCTQAHSHAPYTLALPEPFPI